MRKAPSIVMHIPDDWPSTKLVERISAFHYECIERRIENMDLRAEQKIVIIDGIIRILKNEKQTEYE